MAHPKLKGTLVEVRSKVVLETIPTELLALARHFSELESWSGFSFMKTKFHLQLDDGKVKFSFEVFDGSNLVCFVENKSTDHEIFHILVYRSYKEVKKHIEQFLKEHDIHIGLIEVPLDLIPNDEMF